MLTKSALSFAGKSVLVGAIFPSLLFATQVNAHPSVAKKDTKSSLTRSVTTGKRQITQPHKKQRLASQRKATRAAAQVLTTQHQPSSVHSQTVTAFPLGSFTLRAYTHFPSPEKALSRTSTGTIPEPGRTIAVDPRVIPLGAKIYIEGLGERIAEDSGAKIKGKQIDVFLPSRDHCRRFGVQSRDVMVMIE